MAIDKSKMLNDAMQTAGGFIDMPQGAATEEIKPEQKDSDKSKKKTAKKTNKASSAPQLMFDDSKHATKWALKKTKDENGNDVEIDYDKMSMQFPRDLMTNLTAVAKARRVSRNKLIIDLLSDAIYKNPINIKLAEAQKAADKLQAEILAGE
jgi:hypothetical protein